MQPNDLPSEYTETVTLKDGRSVLLRPIRPEDAPLLQEGYERLSPQTIYMRFLEVASSLSDEQALELATVDYVERMAFVGEIREDNQAQLVSVARYSVVPGSHPLSAEIAIVVRDDYQGQGLGKLAMRQLILYARDHKISSLYGTIHTTNQRVANFITKSGFEFDRNMLEPGVWEYRINLEPEASTGAHND